MILSKQAVNNINAGKLTLFYLEIPLRRYRPNRIYFDGYDIKRSNASHTTINSNALSHVAESPRTP